MAEKNSGTGRKTLLYKSSLINSEGGDEARVVGPVLVPPE